VTDTAYEGWALIEQMGFRKTVAKVREVEQFGAKMLRLDVPFFDGDGPPAGFTTRFAGGQSLYQVSPMDEELALTAARQQSDPRPVRPATFRISEDVRRNAQMTAEEAAERGLNDDHLPWGREEDCPDNEEGA
jgi:hypothetical protein